MNLKQRNSQDFTVLRKLPNYKKMQIQNMVDYNFSGMCKLSHQKIDGDVTPKIKSPRNFN